MSLPKLSRTTLVESVVSVIIEKIKNNEFKLGEKLPSEADMSAQFGISRPTIREAISYLIGMGVVARNEQGSNIVADLKLSTQTRLTSLLLTGFETKQLYEARKALEIEIVTFASQRIVEEDVKELERLNKIVSENMNNYDNYWKADLSFHLEVARIADNEILFSMYKVVMNLFDELEENIFRQKNIIDATPQNHINLINALQSGDSVTARKLINKNLDFAEEDMIKIRISDFDSDEKSSN